MELTIEQAGGIIQALPPEVWMALAGVAALLAIWGAYWNGRRLFRKRLKEVMENPGLAARIFRDRYSEATLMRRAGLIEAFAVKNGEDVIRLTGSDKVWIEILMRYKRLRDLKRVLRFLPEKGLFKAFLVALEKPSLAPEFMKALSETEEIFSLRALALSGIGDSFDAPLALDMFQDRLEEIRELAGDPMWPIRFFAVNILLHDSEKRSAKAVWEAFSDPHPLVRKAVITTYHPTDQDHFFKVLFELIMDDPTFEVRKAAWGRIKEDFRKKLELSHQGLTSDQARHLLELVGLDSKEEEAFAFHFLDHDDLEIRRAAAIALQRCGALDRLCLSVDLGDPAGLERNQRLLGKAMDVNVDSFLSVVDSTDNPATLSLCARLLYRMGDRSLITPLAIKVLPSFQGEPKMEKIYKETVATIAARGREEALGLVAKELERWGKDGEMMSFLLKAVSERGDVVFLPRLLGLLILPGGGHDGLLRSALLKMPQPPVMDKCMEIIMAERGLYPHSVRMEALELLGEMNAPYCLGPVLENLSTLTGEEAREFARKFSNYPKKLFIEKVEHLFSSSDSKVRGAIIHALPSTGEKRFIKSIKNFLKDPDPEVRVASAWALAEFQDNQGLILAFSLLRDPVREVRESVARILGESGVSGVGVQLNNLLTDKNEVDPVKEAAIQGLATCEEVKAVDFLVDWLDKEETLSKPAKQALSGKTSSKSLKRLVERFKDAGTNLREAISDAFTEMGEAGESSIMELYQKDIASLKPHLDRIVESIGLVENRVRRLSHRDQLVRKDAAGFLAMVATQSAYRGIVLAARDPDEDVRVEVIKALEKLESKSGRPILEALEQDPDKRVRKYTHWALERLRSKSL